jgi:hypothetical protein
MGYTTSTVHGIEVPDSAEANNVPEDIGKVVTALETGSLIKRLTGAAIAALTAPQKPAGLVVYNTTTNKLQVSNGTSFVDIDYATYAEMERPSGTQSIPAGPTTVTYSTEVDPSSIANTGTGQLSLTAGVWALSFFVTVSGAACSFYLYAGSRTVDYRYDTTAGLNATVYLSGATTVRAEIVNPSTTMTASLARLTAVRLGPA